MRRNVTLPALLVVVALLVIGVAAYAAPAAQPPADAVAQPDALPVRQDDLPAYLTLNLKAGFPLDPFIVSANGGGPNEASALDPACTGWINTNPTLDVTWEGNAELVRIFYHSDHDPVLVVQTPDGKYVCNDNAGGQLLDPSLTMTKPAAGHYRVWVGAADEKQLVPGVLVITTKSAVTAGQFDLKELVKRDLVSDVPEPAPTDQADREALAASLAGAALKLRAARDTGAAESFSQKVTAQGTLAAHELPQDDAFCNGFISQTPDLVFTVPEDQNGLFIYFEGDGDGSLVVLTPDKKVLCNDDAIPGNANPLVWMRDPAPGQYSVVVGRVKDDKPVTGTLYVSKLSKRPVQLNLPTPVAPAGTPPATPAQ
jgi:hypothetical protein